MPPEPYNAINFRQEAFSGAYIRAVCAVTGCALNKPEPDDDKIDFTLSSRVIGSVRTKPKIDLQAKCQISGAAQDGDNISYSLDLATYNNLRDPLVSNPRYLVVLLAPTSTDSWIAQNEQEMVFKHCAYWVSLKGMAASENSTEQTVYLPRSNVFTPDVLRRMMERASNGEDMA